MSSPLENYVYFCNIPMHYIIFFYFYNTNFIKNKYSFAAYRYKIVVQNLKMFINLNVIANDINLENYFFF